MDEIHQQAQLAKQKLRKKEERDDAMDILTDSIGFDPKKGCEEEIVQQKEATKKEWPTEVDKNGKKKKENRRCIDLQGNDEALQNRLLRKIPNDKKMGGYFGSTLGGFQMFS